MYLLPEKLEVSNSSKFVTPFFKPYEIPTQFIKELGSKKTSYESLLIELQIRIDEIEKIIVLDSATLV